MVASTCVLFKEKIQADNEVVSVDTIKDEIIYVSLDADGCVYNDGYHKERVNLLRKKLFEFNPALPAKRVLELIPEFNSVSSIYEESLSTIREKLKIITDVNKSLFQFFKTLKLVLEFNKLSVRYEKLRVTIEEELKLITDVNAPLFQFFSKIKPSYLFCGSARQCYYFDKTLSNQNKTSNFLQVLPAIAKYIANKAERKIILDKFLIGDIYNGAITGNHFDSTKASSEKDGYYIDDYKGILLYLQLHRAACFNKDKKIKFYFIDDREQILKELYTFFKIHPDLMPINVELHLMQYTGEALPKCYNTSLKGQGPIDYNYSKNAKLLCILYNNEQWERGKSSKEIEESLYESAAALCPEMLLLNLNGSTLGRDVLSAFKPQIQKKRGVWIEPDCRGLMTLNPEVVRCDVVLTSRLCSIQ